MRRLDRRLRDEVREARQRDAGNGDERFRGLYVSDGQIDAILNATDTPVDFTAEDSGGRELPARLSQLAGIFGLGAFEIETLLLCLLPDVDLKYERLYAYLQDDVTKKRPTVETVLRLLCPTLGDNPPHPLEADAQKHESASVGAGLDPARRATSRVAPTGHFRSKIELRQAFHTSAPLFKNRLLRFAEDRLSPNPPLLARQLEIDERISAYLLGLDQIDARLLPFVRLIQPGARLDEVIIPDDTKLRLAEFARRFKDDAVVLHFHGSAGAGKETTAEALCREVGASLLLVGTGGLPEDSPLESLLPLVFREGRLRGAVLCLDCDRLLTPGKETAPASHMLQQEVDAYPRWVILSGEQEPQPTQFRWRKPFVSIEFPLPSYSLREQAWQTFGGGYSFEDGVDFSDLAGRFRLGVGQVRDAVVMARNLAIWRSPADGAITLQDINEACRRMSRPGLSTLARKVASNYVWQDIILPQDQVEHLREICSYVKYHETVYDEWGFGRKHSRGKGLNALFAGPSGTGKTMAAEIMAGELGFDLYKIDLSTIVSKYIGETEKNLDRIFREAQLSNAILFFDEADALFGKRSEVRDSHDRYANIEVAYLLQKMEDYDGVVILATNLRKNMDEAFARRMHFTIEFPMPEEGDRLRIWRGVFPAEAPLAKEADLGFVARQFKISGGNIKNIALNAAFLAAQDGKLITIEHLIRATRREYQKIGKLCTEGDFAQYYEVVRG